VGRETVDFELVPLPVTDPPLGPPPLLPPDPVDCPIEDPIDGLEGYDSNLNLSVKVSKGIVEMSQGTVLSGSTADGLLAYAYSYSAHGFIYLIGLHGDTHEFSHPVFRATVKVEGGHWTLVRVDENGLGLEPGTVFNFHPVS
jgi:hypothetical protein